MVHTADRDNMGKLKKILSITCDNPDSSDVNSVIGGTSETPDDLSNQFVDSYQQDNDKLPCFEDVILRRTISFMDYRRLRRRFHGVRKPISMKKALMIVFFCAGLALIPFLHVQIESDHYIVGVKINNDYKTYISGLAFICAVYILAWIQLSLPLRWPVAISYIFMFSTLIIMLIMKTKAEIHEFVWVILATYGGVQVLVIAITKMFIAFGPLLALQGWYFPCSEHFNLLQRHKTDKILSITISRYNDYSVMCGSSVLGICMCLYRATYRWLRWCYRKYNSRVLGNILTKGEAPFSHQMRYNGEVDENSLPHGYGEWLEDHSYGERLKGYWWHGYPIGPFSSQEIGSGSIFTNTRVAFITNTRNEPGKTRFGVTCTECSMSGNFFRDFPSTYFFNPYYNNTEKNKSPNIPWLYSRVPYFNVLCKDYDQISGASIHWCVRMLKSQFYLNMPRYSGSLNIYVDKISKSLRVEGHKRSPELEGKVCDEITIKLNPNGGHDGQAGSVRTAAILTPSGTHRITIARKSVGLLEVASQKSSAISNVGSLGVTSVVAGGYRCKSNYRASEIADVFLDEDDWKIKLTGHQPMLTVNGFIPIRSMGNLGLVIEEAVIYIHGYNVTLAEACSQMAHLVSFSKLPPYILPFVFNWDGKHWGCLSAFCYPKAKAIANHSNLESSFIEFLNELKSMGIKYVHFVIHSCGARVFFKVFHASLSQELFFPVCSSDSWGVSSSPSHHIENRNLMDGVTRINVTSEATTCPQKTRKSHAFRMNTCILLNPDYPMKKFRDFDYFILRCFCNNIVMYVDTRDQCLTFSEWYNRERSLGRCTFGMCTSSSYISSLPGIESSIPQSSDFDYACMDSIKKMRLRNYTLYSRHHYEDLDESASAKDVNELGNTMKNDYANEGLVDEYDEGGIPVDKNSRYLWLDMDVIDTSMIDTNVDFLKHSLYQMKREIMDDLREVILLDTRAEQRQTRLDRRRGNVYVFRVAPANVGNLFSTR